MDKIKVGDTVWILVDPKDGGGKAPMILWVESIKGNEVVAKTCYDTRITLYKEGFDSVWSTDDRKVTIESPMP